MIWGGATAAGAVPAVGIWEAAATGDIAAIKQHVSAGTDLDAQDPRTGSTPLNSSVFSGQIEASVLLIEGGADVNARSRDGGTPLHTAAFFGHVEAVKLLLDRGADVNARGGDGQTALDRAASPWSQELEQIYKWVDENIPQVKLDLEKIKTARPGIAAILRGYTGKADGAYPAPAAAGDLKPVKLPAPRMTGGRPLMEVLKDRKSTRSFAKTRLPDQVLSNLLWAAWGINRPERGLHTAPSSSNQQEIDVYVALEEGLYIYVPKAHELRPVVAGDLRGATGTQGFVRNVPLNLVYVADHQRMYAGTGMDANMKRAISSANAGFISQNVYLFCASEGLGTVVRGLFDGDALAKRMKLRPDQVVIYTQSVGYPRGPKQTGF